MAFHNVLFPVDYSRNAVGGPMFRTTVVTAGSGYEQRNVDWDAALCRWDLSRLLYDEDTVAGTLAFFRARRGAAHSFLFKDWKDYDVGMEWVGSGPAVHTHIGAQNFAEGDGAATVFALEKVYIDSGGYTEHRRISRPVSPIKVYLNDVEQVSGFSVDYTTGKITFTSAPGVGVDVGWSGEFYVPVRFENDDLQIDYLSPTSGEVKLLVREVREP